MVGGPKTACAVLDQAARCLCCTILAPQSLACYTVAMSRWRSWQGCFQGAQFAVFAHHVGIEASPLQESVLQLWRPGGTVLSTVLRSMQPAGFWGSPAWKSAPTSCGFPAPFVACLAHRTPSLVARLLRTCASYHSSC